jgi:hypothetical protein
MLVPQGSASGTRRHGSPAASLSELRRGLATPSALSSGHRQRLLELAQRLRRIQSLGDDWAGVDFSEYVAAATERDAAAA